MKRILITGANSYIGTSFEKYIKQWSDDYTVDTVDMLEECWHEKSFAGYDTIFHVAGIAHSDNGKISEEKRRLYYAVNTDLTVETAQKAKKEGVKQFIFMSSAIVYGDSAPIGKEKVINIDTSVSPANCYGDSKVQAEKGLLCLEDEDFKVVILRPPMIYGKGCTGNFVILQKIAHRLLFFPYVKNNRSMLYIENLCEFIRLMIKNCERGVFWPQNSEYSNTSEIIQKIACINGKKIIFLKGFTIFLKLLSKLTKIVNKAFGNLCYEKSLSEYKENYQIFSLNDSIERIEQG